MHVVAALLLASAAVAGERFLVSTEWLAKNRDRTIVVHVGSPESFASAHIPGAHFLDLARLVETRNGRSD